MPQSPETLQGQSLEGMRIIVTGAGGGIGSQICRTLHAAGAVVFLTDLTPDPLKSIAQELGAAGFAAGDLTDEAAVADVFDAAVNAMGGAIVNIASVAGLCAFPASNAYSVSKAGAIMMTRTLSLDLARAGIRVNAVAPGVIDAPMAYTVMKHGDETQRMMERRIPMGRLGTTEEVADVVHFLMSRQARYVTGAVIPVDGGWSAFGGPGNASNAIHGEPA